MPCVPDSEHQSQVEGLSLAFEIPVSEGGPAGDRSHRADGDEDSPGCPVGSHRGCGRHLMEQRSVEQPVVHAHDPADELDQERPHEEAISSDNRGPWPDTENEARRSREGTRLGGRRSILRRAHLQNRPRCVGWPRRAKCTLRPTIRPQQGQRSRSGASRQATTSGKPVGPESGRAVLPPPHQQY